LPALPSLGPQDDDAAHDERERDRHRRKERRLDRLFEQQSEHDRRDSGDDYIEREAPRLRTARQAGHDAGDAPAKLPAHRENRAELNHDVEGLRVFVGEVEQTARDDQMPGARHRQKLRQTFDDAQNQRLASQ